MRHILYPAPVTFDTLGFQWDSVEDEILLRTRLLLATFDSAITAFGIVDAEDPQTAYSGGSRPFSVQVNTSDTSTIDINPGTAVFKNGEIIVINSVLEQIALANGATNARNIVYLEFGEEEKDPVVTRFLTLANSKVDYYTDPKDYLKVLDENDYNALTVAEKDLTIPLAVATVQLVASGGGTATQITIDMERTSFAANRPWFSVVDATHRSHVGTGVQTDTNTHALSYNDISATSDLTLFQLLLDNGMIVAKDKGLAGVPGALCTEVIPASAVYVDDAAGTVTGISFSYYFSLSRFPLLVARCTDDDTKVKDYAPAHIPGKNLVFLLPTDEYVGTTTAQIAETTVVYPLVFAAETLDLVVDGTAFTTTFGVGATPLANVVIAINTAAALVGTAPVASDVAGHLVLTSPTAGSAGSVQVVGGTAQVMLGLPLATVVGDSGKLEVTYSAVEACEPPTSLINTTFPIKQPVSLEAVIAGGVVLPSLATTELTFEDAGQIPAEYHIYIDENGVANRYPQTIYCIRKLVDIGLALQDFDTAMKGSAKLRVGLTGAAPGVIPPLSIKVEITGTDANGTIITEVLVFGSTYTDSFVPTCVENSNQWRTTTNTFASVTSWLVTERLNDGPASAVTIQALVNPIMTSQLADILPVARIMWDGLQICELWDQRPINCLLKTTSSALAISSGGKGLSETSALLWDRQVPGSSPNYVLNFWAEDFDRPGYISTEVTDTSVATGLAPTETLVQKVYEGLGPGDTYISKPVAITPNLSVPHAFRIIPVEPGITFFMTFRYYTNAAGWSNWTNFGTMVYPYYTLDVSAEAAGDIVKWQMCVRGEVKGIIATYLSSVLAYAPSFIWDSGAWGEGTLG